MATHQCKLKNWNTIHQDMMIDSLNSFFLFLFLEINISIYLEKGKEKGITPGLNVNPCEQERQFDGEVPSQVEQL